MVSEFHIFAGFDDGEELKKESTVSEN